jgi:hypothetical protein
MRVFVALGETALIGAVLYFAAIGYKHLFAVWPWHALFGKRGRASRHPDFRMVA